MQKTDNNNKTQPPPQKNETITLKSLTDDTLTKYLKKFLTIEGYKTIEQGKDLLKLISQQKNDKVLEKCMKSICYFLQHATIEGKVCGLQFLKEVMELGKIKVFAVIEKNSLGVIIDAVQYRNHVKSLVRGSTYFMRQIGKCQKQAKVAQLVRLSNTYFRMSHQMLYVWGVRYFPNSHFGIVYNKLSKYCTFPEFPSDFKFYRMTKIEQIEKKNQVVQINRYCKERASNVVPALSNRSNRSNRSKNEDEGEADKDVKNKRESSQIPGKQIQIKEENQQQDVFQNQRSMTSQIFKKPEKKAMKPKKALQKIPPNIVYRQSSVEDPQDITNQYDRLNEKQNNSLDVPLGVIQELNTEDGSSKAQSKNYSQPSRSHPEKSESFSNHKDLKAHSSIQEQKDENQNQNQNQNQQTKTYNKNQLAQIKKFQAKKVTIQNQTQQKTNKTKTKQNNIQNKIDKPQVNKKSVQQKPINIFNQEISKTRDNKDIKQLSKPKQINNLLQKNVKNQLKVDQKRQQRNSYQVERQINQQKIHVWDLRDKLQVEEINQLDIVKLSNVKREKKIVVQNNWFNEEKGKNVKNQIQYQKQKKIEVKKSVLNIDTDAQNPQDTKPNIKPQTFNPPNQTTPKQKPTQPTLIKQAPSLKTYQSQSSQHKELPLQSHINIKSQPSSQNLKKSSSLSNRHHSRTKKFKKKKIFDEDMDNENDVGLKNSDSINVGQVKRKLNKPLSLNYSVFDIKEVCYAGVREMKKKEQIREEVESERIMQNKRKLRKFREVALAIVPDFQAKEQKIASFFEAQKSQIQTMTTKLVQQIVKITQQKSSIQQNNHLLEIKQLLKKHSQPQPLPSSLPSDIPLSQPTSTSVFVSKPPIQGTKETKNSQKQLAFFSKSKSTIPENNSKIRNRSNSSKRSSLSQIRNKNQNLYEEGTMLYFMMKRRSIIN